MDNIIQHLQSGVELPILEGKDLDSRYIHIWKMGDRLNAKAVCLPKNTEEVAHILKTCNKVGQKIVIHGGLTNLVGSTENHPDDIIVSLEKMNNIEEVDPSSRTMTVQSGVILENVQSAAKENDLFFPLNFGAKGSAQIGGIISNNAGGLRVLRFGMTRALVLGLEVVLPDGTIINSLKKIIKDNSAYDLKQLFVGAEGTLGIVTRAVLKLVEQPRSRVSAMVSLSEYNQVVNLLKFMDGGLAGTLSGFELIWGDTYQMMTSPPATQKPPLPYGQKYYVLIEALGSDQDKDQERLENLLTTAFENEMIVDGTLANTVSDLEWFWTIREDVHVLKSQCNNDHHFDISIPIREIGHTIDSITDQLNQIDGVEKICTFGHVADGNIHYIIGKEDAGDELRKKINNAVYGPLKKLGGSVSAEHGIGVHKKDYLSLCRSDEEIELMKKIKMAIDPNNILNPQNIF